LVPQRWNEHISWGNKVCVLFFDILKSKHDG